MTDATPVQEPVLLGGRCLTFAALAVLLLSAGLVAASEPARSAAVKDEKSFDAKLIACDESGVFTLDGKNGRRRLPGDELVRWGAPVDARRGPLVVTADEGILVAQPLRLEPAGLTLDSPLFGQVALPLESAAGIVFRLPADPALADRLVDKIVHATDRTDAAILRAGDRITGTLSAVSPDAIEMKTEAGPVRIDARRLSAVVFNPLLRRRPDRTGPRTWVGLADGSRLAATKLVLNDSTLRLTPAVLGTKPDAAPDSRAAEPRPPEPWTTDAAELVFVQPVSGKAVYLSDLTPSGYRHVPFLDLAWPYRTDRNATAGRLRAGGQLYLKGLGTHASAGLSYALDRPYRRFDAQLAVDDSTNGGGSVRFRVYVDRKMRFESDVLRGGDAPVDVSLDLTGAKRLDLIVDRADRGDQLDHADWLDARLVPEHETKSPPGETRSPPTGSL